MLEITAVHHTQREMDIDVISETQGPLQFYVLLINDDYTPMEFVVDVLVKFFDMNSEQAFTTMMAVHENGLAICGIYSKDVAESKAAKVNGYARNNQHPLMCATKPAH